MKNFRSFESYKLRPEDPLAQFKGSSVSEYQLDSNKKIVIVKLVRSIKIGTKNDKK